MRRKKTQQTTPSSPCAYPILVKSNPTCPSANQKHTSCHSPTFLASPQKRITARLPCVGIIDTKPFLARISIRSARLPWLPWLDRDACRCVAHHVLQAGTEALDLVVQLLCLGLVFHLVYLLEPMVQLERLDLPQEMFEKSCLRARRLGLVRTSRACEI